MKKKHFLGGKVRQKEREKEEGKGDGNQHGSTKEDEREGGSLVRKRGGKTESGREGRGRF